MIRYSDIPNMTITEIGRLAREIAASKPGSKRARQLAERMCAASLYLENSGALGQLMWWAKDTMIEVPPDAKARIFVMPSNGSTG